MQRRDFLKSSVALAVAAELGTNRHKDSSVLTIGIDTILVLVLL